MHHYESDSVFEGKERSGTESTEQRGPQLCSLCFTQLVSSFSLRKRRHYVEGEKTQFTVSFIQKSKYDSNNQF